MNSNHGGLTTRIEKQMLIRSKRSAGTVAALFESVRQRRARSRNLAELGALDGLRLQDIGLSEHERALIICGSWPSLPVRPSGRFGRFNRSRQPDREPKLNKGKIQ